MPSPPWLSALDDGPARDTLAQSLLPYLVRQRWFPGKARHAGGARLADWGSFDHAGAGVLVLIVEVTFADGGEDRFCVPLGVSPDAPATGAGAPPADATIARIEAGGAWRLHETPDVPIGPALLSLVARQASVPLATGMLQGMATTRFDDIAGLPPAGGWTFRRLTGEQSNTSFTFGSRLILKLVRRLEPGLNPEFEIGYHLTERSPFDAIPPLAGALFYDAPGQARTIVAVLQGLVAHRSTGWDHALEAAAAYYDAVVARGTGVAPVRPTGPWHERASSAIPPDVMALMGDYPAVAALLGRRTAGMHRALSVPAGDIAFEPRVLDAAARAALARDLRAHGAGVLDLLAAHVGGMRPEVASQARTVAAARQRVLARFDALAALDADVVCIRVHGDYHLGQVLWTGTDVVILDFEGEPLRPIDERRRPQSPLKDVTGMLRSFGYAAWAALFTRCPDPSPERARLEPWARAWDAWASAAFLRGYVDGSRGAAYAEADAVTFDAWLDAFLLDKALYELKDELNNRPDWVGIPLSSMDTD